jgi:hypothetical protein
MSSDNEPVEIAMNATNLYKDESFTDRQVGVIQRLTPVTQAGDADDSREILFYGHTQIMTEGGPMPLNFKIEAEALGDAVLAYGEAAKKGIADTMKKIEEYRRQQASSIIVPGAEKNGPKIQL